MDTNNKQEKKEYKPLVMFHKMLFASRYQQKYDQFGGVIYKMEFTGCDHVKGLKQMNMHKLDQRENLRGIAEPRRFI